MKKFLAILSFVFCLSFLKSQVQTNISIVKYEELEEIIQETKDKFLVLNFWSTTCAPCVKELPEFIEVNEQFKNNSQFKMILVSLDRAKDKQKVINFIKNKNLTAEVILLDDIKRMNTWIPRFDENWDGVIPVTVFYKNGKKISFNNGEMSKEELLKTINTHFNN